jgi:rhamnosyltransferase
MINIICPIYNGEKYILDLYKNICRQENVKINKITFLLTESNDLSETILKNNKLNYVLIKKDEFSHSLTREQEAMKSNADVIVFISQDIVIESTNWLFNLTKDIFAGKCEAAFSRQISKFNNIEKYTREKNYPAESRIVSIDDLEKLGLRTFFFSDASSAIKTSVFKELKGYDGKRLPINEDMYFAYKLIMNKYRIAYEADSIVYHSHNFTLKEIYNRYKLTGKFFKENSYLDSYGTTSTGGGLAKYILKRILRDHKIGLLFRFPFDMGARYLGMKVGEKQP